MAEQVVFVNGKSDVEIACELYGDAPAFRVSLFNFGELSPLNL